MSVTIAPFSTYHGELVFKGAQCGTTASVTGANADLNQATDFSGAYPRFYMIQTTADIKFILAKIGAYINECFCFYVKNIGTYQLTVRDSTDATTLATIAPQQMYLMHAEVAAVPDVWMATVVSGESLIDLQNQGVAVANTPHKELNFTGNLVTATDVDGDTADITVNLPSGNLGIGTIVDSFADETEKSTTSSSFVQRASFTTSALDNTKNYAIWWYCEFKNSNNAKSSEIQIKLGGTEIGIHGSVMWIKGFAPYDEFSGFKPFTGISGTTTVQFNYRAHKNTVYCRRVRALILQLD